MLSSFDILELWLENNLTFHCEKHLKDWKTHKIKGKSARTTTRPLLCLHLPLILTMSPGTGDSRETRTTISTSLSRPSNRCDTSGRGLSPAVPWSSPASASFICLHSLSRCIYPDSPLYTSSSDPSVRLHLLWPHLWLSNFEKAMYANDSLAVSKLQTSNLQRVVL